MNKPLKPLAVNKGDTIAIVAPASPPCEGDLSPLVANIEREGYQVKLAHNLQEKWGYLAGTDTRRAAAFMGSWLDPDAKVVWCIRGGYGCGRLLPLLDFDALKKTPKIFIGMSDITALHSALNQKSNLVTYLGPNIDFVYGSEGYQKHGIARKGVWDLISQKEDSLQKTPYTYATEDKSVKTLRPGVAHGRIVGGTLSLIASQMGTSWALETEGKIVVLEDVGEPPYRIDRYLCQLKQGRLLSRPAGVILCSWNECTLKNPKGKSLSLEEIFYSYFKAILNVFLIDF